MPRAGIVKTDLRSKVSSQQFFVVFCAARNTPNQAYAGLAAGSVDSEYQWAEVISYSTLRVSRAEGVTVPAFDSCARNALVDKSSLFIASVDESVFKTAKALLNHNSKPTQTQKASDLFQKDAASVSSAAGLHVPDSTSSALEFVNQIVRIQSAVVHRTAWSGFGSPQLCAWSLSLESVSANPATQSNGVPTQEQSHDNFISTGVEEVPQIDRAALLRLYQAVAEAEDNPNLYYDVELQIEDKALVKVYVHPLEPRHDPPTEKGDSACIYFTGDPTNADPIDLL